MNKIVINLSEDEKYPDYSMERVYGSSGDIHIGFFLYLLLLLAEKIADWKDGKLGSLYDRYRALSGGGIATSSELWEKQFGEEEETRLRLLAEKGMERSSIPFDEEQFSREYQAMERMRRSGL